ncbi:hypothetical protein DFJ74DRAFT_318649 [Hyaloraphidium curvatum]|nr:hypothetical protein DFJ74DRAFT_318649 [Hyaloraphidium curvatum]
MAPREALSIGGAFLLGAAIAWTACSGGPGPPRAGTGLTFVRYVPSAWEREWTSRVRNASFSPDVCLVMKLPAEQERSDAYLARAAAFASGSEPLRAPDDGEDPVLSKMVYRRGNAHIAHYLEPLVGGLRHPHMCRPGAPDVVLNRSFLIPERADPALAAPPRTLLFDLGAASWSEGPGGASPAWFDAEYARGGLPFSRMFMWEAAPVDQGALFRGIPERMRAHVRYFNVPVEQEPGGLFNAFNVLLAEAAEDDHVVVKLDIDSPYVENEVVQQLMRNPRILGLVDEFYFEHHAYWLPMARMWACNPQRCQSLRTSYGIFDSLRRMGVRAHSWT